MCLIYIYLFARAGVELVRSLREARGEEGKEGEGFQEGSRVFAHRLD